MPKRKKIDNKKLIQMVKDGKVQKEILEKFGFNTSTQLKIAYANALMDEGQAPEIKTGTKGMVSEKAKNAPAPIKTAP
ncbi:MAG: hypothetical protein K9L59_03635 [Desulfobacterales bacterium]|nr:hypothetical protein [Desulfobacterales bacterium]